MKRYFYKQNQFQTTKFIFFFLSTHFNHSFQPHFSTFNNHFLSTRKVLHNLLISDLPILKFNHLDC